MCAAAKILRVLAVVACMFCQVLFAKSPAVAADTAGPYGNGAYSLRACFELYLSETMDRAEMEWGALLTNIDTVNKTIAMQGWMGALNDWIHYGTNGSLTPMEQQIQFYYQRIETIRHIYESILIPSIDEENLAVLLSNINAARRLLNLPELAYNCRTFMADNSRGIAFTSLEDYVVYNQSIDSTRDIVVTTAMAAGGIGAAAYGGTAVAAGSLVERILGAAILGCIENGGEALIEALDKYRAGIWTEKQLRDFVMKQCGMGASIGGGIANAGEVPRILNELRTGGVLK